MNKDEQIQQLVGDGLQFRDFKLNIFPGTDRNASVQEIADAILASIKELVEGNSEVVDSFDD